MKHIRTLLALAAALSFSTPALALEFTDYASTAGGNTSSPPNGAL